PIPACHGRHLIVLPANAGIIPTVPGIVSRALVAIGMGTRRAHPTRLRNAGTGHGAGVSIPTLRVRARIMGESSGKKTVAWRVVSDATGEVISLGQRRSSRMPYRPGRYADGHGRAT